MTKSIASSSFNLKTVVAACTATEKALLLAVAKATNARNAALDALADKFRTAGVKVADLKGNAASNPVRAAVKAMFDHLVEKGAISKASAATYGTCFWIAFEKGCPFSTDLANQKTEAKKSANVGKGKAKAKADANKVKGSIVVKASRDNLQSLLMQTIKMSRDLGLGTFATELVASGKSIDLLPKDFK